MSEIIVVGNIYDETGKNKAAGRVYGGGGIAPTLGASHFCQEKLILEDMEKIYIKENNVRQYAPCEIGGVCDLRQPTSTTRRGRVIDEGRICPTLQTDGGISRIEMSERFRIRKLTPRECFRLMDFDDEDFNAAQEVNSNTQLYKQAGNSIVVGVLEQILKQML